MKIYTKLTIFLGAALLLVGCGERFPTRYVIELPVVPQAWVSILGEPLWRIECLSPNGQIQKMDITHGQHLELEIPVTWTNPVTAWPWWPQHGLIPKLFKPAGGLFPFDASEKKLHLSWKAGVDTVFYWELAYANYDSVTKIPSNFDWPRFRSLFETDALSEAVRKDPWLVDWKNVAERTISSNFDRRRIVPQSFESVSIPVSEGPWYSASPFAQALYFEENITPVFPVGAGVNVWISGEGILRANGKTWVFSITQ